MAPVEVIIFNGHGQAVLWQGAAAQGEFMIRITQLKLPVGHTPEQLKKKIAKTLKCAEDTFSYEIVRQSLDARHKDDKKFVYTVDVKTAAEQKFCEEFTIITLCQSIKGLSVSFAGNRETGACAGYCWKWTGRTFLRLVSGKSRLSSTGSGTRSGGAET